MRPRATTVGHAMTRGTPSSACVPRAGKEPPVISVRNLTESSLKISHQALELYELGAIVVPGAIIVNVVNVMGCDATEALQCLEKKCNDHIRIEFHCLCLSMAISQCPSLNHEP